MRRVTDAEDREACYAIRMRVFVEEQNVPPWEEMDEFDETAEHYAAEVDGRIVGTARLVDKGEGVAKIGRVAVLPEHRGQGIGRELMLHVIRGAEGRFDTLMLDAQLQVIPLYESLGFVVEGGVFLDAGIKHRRMVRRLKVEG